MKKSIALFFIFTIISFANDNSPENQRTLEYLRAFPSEILYDLFLDGKMPKDAKRWSGSLDGGLVQQQNLNTVAYYSMDFFGEHFWNGKTFCLSQKHIDDNLFILGQGNNRMAVFSNFEHGALWFDILREPSAHDGKSSVVLLGKTQANSFFQDEARVVTIDIDNEQREVFLGFVNYDKDGDRKNIDVWWALFPNKENNQKFNSNCSYHKK